MSRTPNYPQQIVSESPTKLETRQIQQLHAAMLDAYTTEGQLAQMVRFGLGENLYRITGFHNLDEAVFDLISWAERTGRLIDLLNAAKSQNSGNRILSRIVDELTDDLLNRQPEPPAAHRSTNTNSGAEEIETEGFLYPFGEVSCEYEVEVLRQGYSEFYYSEGKFNKELLDPERYLVVGRRGSGKTSLIEYCGFQTQYPNAHHITIIEPEEFHSEWHTLIEQTLPYGNYGTLAIANMWEFVLWLLIFDHLEFDLNWVPYIEADTLRELITTENKVSSILQSLLQALSNESEALARHFPSWISQRLKSAEWTEYRTKALSITKKRPILLTIDTFERYGTQDEILLQTTAALIECVSNMNVLYSRSKLYAKVFIASEIFPYIKESVISNTTKFIRNPVMLVWTPRDLVKLTSWRFYQFLNRTEGHEAYQQLDIDWNNFDDVLNTLWHPFFGETVYHPNGRVERSFPYIMRHTHMRPRELVIICNRIAKAATEARVFPKLYRTDITTIVEDTTLDLADETLNSYSQIYPHVGDIVATLRGSPALFQGKYLDQIAKHTSSLWPAGTYSLARFRRLVAELGIVGRVRSHDEHGDVFAADFEYNLSERLSLRNDDDCVIHPMFYSKLDIDHHPNTIVYPFPKKGDYTGSLMQFQ